jgi:elongation factor G
LKATLIDGSYHEVDSSEMAFKIAGSMALKEGVRHGSPALLEPMMNLEVTSPEEYIGDVISSIASRRGMIEGVEVRSKGVQSIEAIVPLSEMFGYATVLRSNTQGRASFTMEFAHYDQVPEGIVKKVLGD